MWSTVLTLLARFRSQDKTEWLIIVGLKTFHVRIFSQADCWSLLEDNVLNAVCVWKRKVANGSEIGSNYWASLTALSRRLDEAQRVVIARCWHIQACLLSRPLTFTDTLIGGTDRHPELLTTASVLHCVQRLPIDSLACVCVRVCMWVSVDGPGLEESTYNGFSTWRRLRM